MYESALTDEDLELDRYGLGEGAPVSGSEDSDVEEILYSQIHYNLADSEKVQTDYSLSILSDTTGGKDPFTDSNKLQNDDGKIISDCLEERSPAFTEKSASGLTVRSNVRSATTGNLERTGNTISDLNKQGKYVDTLAEAKCNLKNRVSTDSGVSGLGVIVSDGERVRNDLLDSKYAIRKKNNKRTTNAKAGTELPSNRDGGKSCDKGNEVIDLCGSSDSDVIFLGRSLSTQKPVPLKSKQRESKLSIDGKTTIATKINRDSLLPKKKRKRKRKKKSSPAEDDIPAEGETNDDSDGITSAKEKQKSAEPEKQRNTDNDEAEKGQTDTDGFFFDNKGMNLDGVKAEMTDPATSWRKERERTKEMLRREKGNLIRIIDSSDDDDCMAIESHSEDEDMHVHFDGKADGTATSGRASSGSWSEKRNRSDRKPEVRGRYFVQSRQKNVKCHNCLEVGHLKLECPKPRRIPACILCGTRGHTDKSCPEALCFNCSQPGHQSWACKLRNLRYAHCSRCDMPGHVKKMCTDHWRQYHMTTEREGFLSPTKRPETSMNQLRDTYCSNCSKSGHRYYDCSGARFDEYTTFTYDGVAKYDNRFKENQRSISDEMDGPPAKRRALETRDYRAASVSNEHVKREDGYYETVHSIYRGVLFKQNPGFFRKSTVHVEHGGGEQRFDDATSAETEPLTENDRQMMAAADRHIKEEDEYYEAMNSAYGKDKSKADASKKSRKRKKSKKDKREVEWMQHDDRTSQVYKNLQESRVVEAYAQVDPLDDRRQRKRKHEFIEDVNDRQARPSHSRLGEADEDVSTTSCLPVKKMRKIIQTKVKGVLDLDKRQSKKLQNRNPVPPVPSQGRNYLTSFNIPSTSTSSGNYPGGMPHQTSTNPQVTEELRFDQKAIVNANETQCDVAPQRSCRGFFLNEELLPLEQIPHGSKAEARSTMKRPEAEPKATIQPCPAAPQMRSVQSDPLVMQSMSDGQKSGFYNTVIKDLSNRKLLDDNGIIDMNKLTEGERKVWKYAETQFHTQMKRKNAETQFQAQMKRKRAEKQIQPPALNLTHRQPPALTSTQRQPPALSSAQGQPKNNTERDSFVRRYSAMSKKERKAHKAQWDQYTDAFIVDLEKRNIWNGKTIKRKQMTKEEKKLWDLAQNKFLNKTQKPKPTYPKGDSFASQYLAMSKTKRKVHEAEWNQYTDEFIADVERRNLWNGTRIDSSQMTAEELVMWNRSQDKFHKMRKEREKEEHRQRQVELGLPNGKFPTKKELKSQRRMQNRDAKKQKKMVQSRGGQQLLVTRAQSNAAHAEANRNAMDAQDFPRNWHPSQDWSGPRRSKRESKPSSDQQKRDCFVS